MTGLFGPTFGPTFGPFFGGLDDEEGLATITGQLDIADGSGNDNSFIVRQIAGVFNYNGKQSIRRDIPVIPNPDYTWSVNLYPSNYYFIFRNGQNMIQEAKTITASSAYEDLEDYTG